MPTNNALTLATEERAIREVGAGLFKQTIRTRVWPSRKEAVAFAISRGFSVQE
jgi:hypothetical protein